MSLANVQRQSERRRRRRSYSGAARTSTLLLLSMLVPAVCFVDFVALIRMID
jgi:hypothetical protein